MKLTQPIIFDIVWKLYRGKSFISDIPLMKYYKTKYHFNMFAHILSKSESKYPFFKLYIGNILLLTPSEHYIIDHCPDELKKTYCKEIKEQYNNRYEVRWDKWDDKKNELIELYKKLFPKVKDGIIWKYTEEEVIEVIMELNKEFVN